jgi:hypothetical protein
MTTALAEYEALQRAVVDAEARLREAHARRRDRVSALENAERALHEHIEAVHAGEAEPDPDVEDQLHRQAREAAEVVTVRIADFGGTSELKLVDLTAEARVTGAKRAMETAEAQLHEFAKQHVAELAAERAGGVSGEVGRTALAAAGAAWRAIREWEQEAGWWSELARTAQRPDLLQMLPENPLAGLKPTPAGVEYGPIPKGLMR